jgi:RNA 3'-terminal phosphate cyclase-like protein
MKPLVFQGHEFLRQRLLLSILSGRSIKIEKVRSDRAEPGLKGMCMLNANFQNRL